MENSKNEFNNLYELMADNEGLYELIVNDFLKPLVPLEQIDSKYKPTSKNNLEVTNKDIKESEKIHIGDKVKIISGEFKTLENIGEVVDFCELLETAVVKFSEFNVLHINIKDLGFVESKKDKDEAKIKRIEMLTQAQEERKELLKECEEIERKYEDIKTKLKNNKIKINNLSK